MSASADLQSVPLLRRTWFWISVGLASCWIAGLAVLTVLTANPVVVNRVQLDVADAVFVGVWEDRSAGKFRVDQDLKQGQVTGVVNIDKLPPAGLPQTDEWVIPVVRARNGFVVAQGEFVNRPDQRRPVDAAPQWKIDVEPRCYPATNDVLRQVDDILKSLPPRK